jgi:peptidyl-prolyl cis-trans isomerase D
MASKQQARSGLPIVHKTLSALKDLYGKNPFLFVLACIGVGIAAVGIAILVVIFVISFLAAPMNRNVSNYRRLSFGSYDGKSIDYAQDNYFGNMVYYIGQQQKDQKTSDDPNANYFKLYQIWRQAFESTVQRFGILSEAAKSGLTISTKRLNREMLKQSRYLDDNGQFSLKIYKSFSDSEHALDMQNLKESMLIQKYNDIASGSDDSKKIVEYVKAANLNERAFTFVSFPFSSFPDSEIKAFGQKNANLFRSIKLSYIEVDKSKPLAQSLLKAISAGTQKFSEAISAAGDKGYSGVDGVDRSYWEIKDLFAEEKDAEAVFALAKDSFSPLMKTKEDKWIFFRCQEAAVEPDFSRLELSSKVWSYIQAREKGSIEAYCLKRAEDFAAKAKTDFAAACKEYGVSAKKLDYFPINYGSFPLILNQASVEEYSELAGISTNEAFLTAAFSLKKGELSKPQVVTDAVTVLRFDDEKKAEENALSTIDFYYQYYMNQYQNEQLNSFFVKSDKLVDKFGENFQKYLAPSTSK